MLQIFGGYMMKYIIERITLLEKTLQLIMSVQPLLSGMQTPGRWYPENAAVGPGHDPVIQPVAQPAAAIAFHLYIRSQGHTGQHAPDIPIVRNIQMTEYLCNRPFIGSRAEIQLLICQAEKGLGAGFYKLYPIQKLRY